VPAGGGAPAEHAANAIAGTAVSTERMTRCEYFMFFLT